MDLKVCPPFSCLTHWCTANPPLLLNQQPHIKHCTAPSCSCTGFWCSVVHLCLALPNSVLKHLPHTLHFTSRGTIYLLLCWSCWCLESPSLHVTYHCFLFYASSYQPLSWILTAFRSLFTIFLHLLLGPPWECVEEASWDSLRGHSV